MASPERSLWTGTAAALIDNVLHGHTPVGLVIVDTGQIAPRIDSTNRVLLSSRGQGEAGSTCWSIAADVLNYTMPETQLTSPEVNRYWGWLAPSLGAFK
ncbi:hypothetical protein LTR15_012773 [Elasticomyces elasticus]|nr:hypothetical protein LTR15_012773 [Elasticomyces elasticus]